MYLKIYYIIIIFNVINYNTFNAGVIIETIKMIKTIKIVIIRVKYKTTI